MRYRDKKSFEELLKEADEAISNPVIEKVTLVREGAHIYTKTVRYGVVRKDEPSRSD